MGLSKKGIIVDATAFHRFVNANHKDSKPVHQSIQKGTLNFVYGNDKKSLGEIEKDGCMFKMWKMLRGNGVAYEVNSKEKKKEIDDNNKLVNGTKLKSNDTHIIATALVEQKARLLFSVSTGDKKLHEDFKNAKIIKNPRGKIYTKTQQSHLLK